ncbi:MAG: hypothetical protein H7Y60_09730 [Rhodospirillaceae bacterium]|nr:hypothetical protein [Rhodospirillales bacterium]
MDAINRLKAFTLSVCITVGMAVASPVAADSLDDKVIATNNEGVAGAIKVEAPRLSKVGEEKRGPVVVETYVSQPSKVRLTLETLPGRGFLPGTAAVIKATMERPLADKPSPYDGGLGKTMRAFIFAAADGWYSKDTDSYVGECLMTLTTSGCDRTVKGVRVVAKRYGTDAFVIEAYRL